MDIDSIWLASMIKYFNEQKLMKKLLYSTSPQKHIKSIQALILYY